MIREYFLKAFYKDHVKAYQKRPIYWLYDSGRKNGFKALIYIHRYDENIAETMRTKYLHRMLEIYRGTVEVLQDFMDKNKDPKKGYTSQETHSKGIGADTGVPGF